MNWVARGFTTANPETGSYNCQVARYYLRVDGYQGATSAYSLTVQGPGVKTLSAPGPGPGAAGGVPVSEPSNDPDAARGWPESR